MPPPPDNLKIEEESTTDALDGLAVEHRAVLSMGPDSKVRMHVAVYIPKSGKAPSRPSWPSSRCGYPS